MPDGLRTKCWLAVRRARRPGRPQPAARPAAADHRSARQRRRVARSGAARPAHRCQRVRRRRAHSSKRSGATRRCSSRASATRRAIRSISSPLAARTRSTEHVAGGARGAVDLRQRSRSAEGPAARAGRRRAAGDSRACVPFREHDLAATGTNWAVVAAARRGVGGARVSESARGAAGSTRCGTRSRDCAASIGPIRWPRGKQHLDALAARRDFLNAQAVQRAALHAARAPT